MKESEMNRNGNDDPIQPMCECGSDHVDVNYAEVFEVIICADCGRPLKSVRASGVILPFLLLPESRVAIHTPDTLVGQIELIERHPQWRSFVDFSQPVWEQVRDLLEAKGLLPTGPSTSKPPSSN